MTPARMAQIHAASFHAAPRPWHETEFVDYLRGPDQVLTEADLAFAVVRVVGDEAEVLTIAVDPGARRKGLARKLMLRIEAWAVAQACRAIILEVSDQNAAARALYQSCGFIEAGYRKNYYAHRGGETHSALVLRKTLNT